MHPLLAERLRNVEVVRGLKLIEYPGWGKRSLPHYRQRFDEARTVSGAPVGMRRFSMARNLPPTVGNTEGRLRPH
jgi:hypothetical protein